MGVHGLWPLLEPVGRRVNIEALSNKRLAIDASIWVHQFIKTMRAADGEVLRNAHLLGFFRRICKLLFNHIRPVFVFDGGTPALKKRTTIARRRAREVQGAKLRKAAEKLLLARMKAQALDSYQAEQALQNSAKKSRKKPDATSPSSPPLVQESEEGAVVDLVKTDIKPDAPVGKKRERTFVQTGGSDSEWELFSEDEDAGPSMQDIHLQQALEASMADRAYNPELEQRLHTQGTQANKRQRTKWAGSAFPYAVNDAPSTSRQLPVPSSGGKQANQGREASEEVKSEDDSEEEIIDEGNLILAASALDQLDPALLSNLPPSMQLDLMTKLREQKMYSNRDGFQQRQAQPKSFSSFQMDEYLKASNIRKQMEDIKGVMNAAVAGNTAASKRIAGEAGREYILTKDRSGSQPWGDDSKDRLSRFVKQGSGEPGNLHKSPGLEGRRLSSSGQVERPGSGALGKPPLAPRRDSSQGLPGAGSHPILPAAPEPAQQGSEGLQISLDLDDIDLAGEEGDEDWEDVDALKTSGSQDQHQGLGPNALAGGVDVSKKPSDWRERMMQRQKFWSHATGFKMGRKLADWGKDNPNPGAAPPNPASPGMGNPAHHDLTEDEELQRAIALSLQQSTGVKHENEAGKDDDNDDDWDDVDAMPLNSPDTKTPNPDKDASQINRPGASTASRRQHDRPAHVPDSGLEDADNAIDVESKHSEEEELQKAIAFSMQQSAAGANQNEDVDDKDEWDEVEALPVTAPAPTPAHKQPAPPAKPPASANPKPQSNGLGAAAAGKQEPDEKVELPDLRLQEADRAMQSGGRPQAALMTEQTSQQQSGKDQDEEEMVSPFKAQQSEAQPDGGAKTKSKAKKKLILPSAHGSPAAEPKKPKARSTKPSKPAKSKPARGSRKAETQEGEAAPVIAISDDDDFEQQPGLRNPVPAPSSRDQTTLPVNAPAPHAAVRETARVMFADPVDLLTDDSRRQAADPSPEEARVTSAPQGASSQPEAASQQRPQGDETRERVQVATPAGFEADWPENDPEGDWLGQIAEIAASPETQQQPRQQEKDRNKDGVAEEFELAPIPDSSWTPGRAVPQGGQAAGRGQAGDAEEDYLLPIPDSSVTHPQPAFETAVPVSRPGGGHREIDPNLDLGDDMRLDSEEMGLEGEGRLDSETLRTMPSELAAELDKHRTSDGQLTKMPSALAQQIQAHKAETKRLQKEHRKQAGISDNPTSNMYGECQELLQMFGLPYIIAPVEAEAQCAWLDLHKLVDGVVTDDNDVFLFGGQHVYRHIFEDKLYVEEYRATDFDSELGLDREKLILLALLLGSDYTDGIAGIGIVNAVEIVNAFQDVEGLKNFKQWVMTPDKDILEAAQKVGRKGRKGKQDKEAPPVDVEEVGGGSAVLKKFKREHVNARKGWNIPNDFPNWRVVSAYQEAKVDTNKEAITYARPDLEHLRIFCLEKFGWGMEKTDEIILPVLKAFDEKQTQATMDSFLNFSQRFAKIKSKRLQKAVSAIRGNNKNSEILLAEGEDAAPAKPRKRAKKAKQAALEPDAGVLEGEEEDLRLSQDDFALLDAAVAEHLSPGQTPAKPRGRGRGRKPGMRGGRPRGGKAAGRGPRGRGRGRKAAHQVEEPELSSDSETQSSESDAENPEEPARLPETRKATKANDEVPVNQPIEDDDADEGQDEDWEDV